MRCNVHKICNNRTVHADGKREENLTNDVLQVEDAAVIPETIVYALNGDEITLKPLLW